MNTQILSGRCSRASARKTSFKMGRASSHTICSVLCWFGMSFGPSISNVGPGYSYVYPRVPRHKAWFVTGQALCNQARVVLFHNDIQHVMVEGLNIYTGVRPFPNGWPSLLSASRLLFDRHLDYLDGPCVSLGCPLSRFQCWSSFSSSLSRRADTLEVPCPSTAPHVDCFVSLCQVRPMNFPRMSWQLEASCC
jgi:hypothetical protein